MTSLGDRFLRVRPETSLASSASAVAGLIVAATVLMSCSGSVSVGEAHIKEARLEGALMDKVTEEAGQAPDDIDCPSDLAGEVGTTMRCVLTAGVDELDVDVEVTSVEGKKVNFEYEIGQIKDDSGVGSSDGPTGSGA